MARRKLQRRSLQFASRAIHVGQEPEAATGAITVPIYQTSTFAQSAPGVHQGYDYSRTDNPTRTALQKALASLESAKDCLAFSSGMGAATTAMLLFKHGDHIVSSRDVYGGTYRLFRRVLQDFGLTFSFVETSNVKGIERVMTRHTRLVWIESPTNPLLRITDIRAAAEIAHRHGALCLVDNTFASPFFQRPLALGADLVLHSTTKYLAGHADVVGGAICLNERSLYERLKFLQNAAGATPSPFDCFLTLRGLKTLALRQERQCANARHLAERLAAHPHIARVHYPGLVGNDTRQAILRRMLRAPHAGALVSIELRENTRAAAFRFMDALGLCVRSTSLGDVFTSVLHPASASHRDLAPARRQQLGISDGLVRISVGIEAIADITNDIEQALVA